MSPDLYFPSIKGDESWLVLSAYFPFSFYRNMSAETLWWESSIGRQEKSNLFPHKASLRASMMLQLALQLPHFSSSPPPPSAAAVLHPSVRRPVTDLLTSSTVSPHLVDWRFVSFVSFLAASRWTPSGSCPSRSLTSATSGSAAPPFHFSGYFFDNVPVGSVRGAHSSGRRPFVTSRRPLCIWRGCRHRADYGSKMLIMSLNILIVVLLLRCLP